MFLRRDYRNRAIGLIAAYALLIAGIVFSGSFESAAPIKAKRADDCSQSLQDRPDAVC